MEKNNAITLLTKKLVAFLFRAFNISLFILFLFPLYVHSFTPLPAGIEYLKEPARWFYATQVQEHLLAKKKLEKIGGNASIKRYKRILFFIKSEKYKEAEKLLLQDKSYQWLNLASLYFFLEEYNVAASILQDVFLKVPAENIEKTTEFLYLQKHPLLCGFPMPEKNFPEQKNNQPLPKSYQDQMTYASGLCSLLKPYRYAHDIKKDRPRVSIALKKLTSPRLRWKLAWLASDSTGRENLAHAIPKQSANSLGLIALPAISSQKKEAVLQKQLEQDDDLGLYTEMARVLKKTKQWQALKKFQESSAHINWHKIETQAPKEASLDPYRLKVQDN